jgi:UDP-2,3-diacylglucosamine pyrophosphatase LpxH
MKKAYLEFKTIILSDVHLGTESCKAREVTHFLRHTRFIRTVLKKMERQETQVVYLRGNHDDVLRHFLPVAVEGLQIVEEHLHDSQHGRYLILHGDVFDAVTQHTKWLAVLGDIGYQSLLSFNRLYNRYRAWRGREYYSLAKAIKARVKRAVSHISNFESHIQTLARARGCAGVICGHIHTPADKRLGTLHYLNSGDWVESMTAIVEDDSGRFSILTYPEFCRRLQERALERTVLLGEVVDDGLEPVAETR